MSLRTYEKNAKNIEIASDVDEIVKDKRKNWRANSTKASQRQRRYKKRLIKQLLILKDIND
mgnify:FL=1